MSREIDVLLIGEALVLFSGIEENQLRQTTTFEKSIAGAELNVAIGLSRLGHHVNYLTKLSTDEFSQYILNRLEKENIPTHHLTTSTDGDIGIMFKNKVTNGDPNTLYHRSNSLASQINKDDLKHISLEQVKILHVTGVFPALSPSTRETTFYLLEKAKQAGCLISFDPNIRPTMWSDKIEMITVLNKIASYADIILPGISEGELLTGLSKVSEIADFYLKTGAKLVVIKQGETGAYVKSSLTESGEFFPGIPVDQVIDTVGAGDGFAVGILDGVLTNKTLSHCIQQANTIGALQVQHKSDNENLPTADELKQLLKTF